MRKIAVVLTFVIFCGDAAAMEKASGAFSVRMTPQEENAADGVTMGRIALSKTFEGDLSGESEGQMLTVVSPTPTSAAYVAAERFEGVLNGRRGAFAMTHRGVVANGEQSLVIEIAPDSGAGELRGISGAMTIDIRGGAHFYTLDYEISE
ncbi:MAG: DUF3224 domain-containing protein [Parvularculaceae bacterium]